MDAFSSTTATGQGVPVEQYVASLSRKRMAAGILFRDDRGRVLLVEPSYKPNWEIPGGVVEACGEIDLAVTKSTRTHHLRILRESGVVSTHTEGTRRISTLRREDLDALYPGLLDGILAAKR